MRLVTQYAIPPAAARGKVRDSRQDRRGRDGRRLQSAPPPSRRDPGYQGHPAPAREPGGDQVALPSRGQDRDQDAPHEHRSDVRLLDGRGRQLVHRHGVHRRHHPAADAQAGRSSIGGPRSRDRASVSAGARLPPPQGHRSQGHLTGQRDDHRGRARRSRDQAHRPRHCQGHGW